MTETLNGCENPKLGLAAEMLRCHGSIQLMLRGPSMLPSLWPGDRLTIHSTTQDDLVPGDMVLVMRANRFFVHRLIETQRDEECPVWITKGDAVRRNDPAVKGSELQGKVTGVCRGHRKFIPSREVSRFQSCLAWMLCRWDGFRAIALRLHWGLLYAAGILGPKIGIPDVSPTEISHSC